MIREGEADADDAAIATIIDCDEENGNDNNADHRKDRNCNNDIVPSDSDTASNINK